MDDWRIAVELALRLGTRLRPRDRRRGHRRDRARRARARGRRPPRCCAARATASCSRSASTATRSCSGPARCRSSPTTVREPRGIRSRSRARSRRTTMSSGEDAADEVDPDRRAAPRSRPTLLGMGRRACRAPSVPRTRRVRSAPRGRVGRSTTTGASSARRPVLTARSQPFRLRINPHDAGAARRRSRRRGAGHLDRAARRSSRSSPTPACRSGVAPARLLRRRHRARPS